MGVADALGFGSILSDFIGIGVESSDRRAANELNYWATMDTNKANAEINESQLAAARENWAREQANFEKQREWSLQDRAYENWYNSPEQLRQRYLKAGLNPALMMQGQSAVGSASASHGQAPQFGSPPGSIPMQAAHFEPTMTGFSDGLGAGMAQLLAIHNAKRESDRADYALASDIMFRQRKSEVDYMEARAALKRLGIDTKRLDQDDRHFMQTMALEQDKFARQNEVDNMALNFEGQKLDIQRETNRIQAALAASNIKLNDASVQMLGTKAWEIRMTVLEMQKNGASKRELEKYLNQKEQELVSALARENRNIEHSDKYLGWWKRGVGAVLEPLKGIISVGIK